MELALALLRLWERRIWVAIGAVLAVAAGVAGMSAFKSTAYSSASTQMVVDAPKSALGNLQTSLLPFTNRAVVFARLMVSPEALTYIGQDAGIPGNEIAAQGPAEIGAPQAIHNPSTVKNGKLVVPKSKFILRFDQNPQLPTVDIYSQAPTTRQAIALANGAVTGFTGISTSSTVRPACPALSACRSGSWAAPRAVRSTPAPASCWPCCSVSPCSWCGAAASCSFRGCVRTCVPHGAPVAPPGSLVSPASCTTRPVACSSRPEL